MKILMVCLGNICRSPLAEGILRAKLQSDQVVVDSAGTAAYHVGQLPDARSIEVARKHGIDITNQHARKFLVEDFEKFDFIFAMDRSNYQNLISMARNAHDKEKVHLILNALDVASNHEVPDPYYGDEDGFETVFNMLDEACEGIIAKIQHKL